MKYQPILYERSRSYRMPMAEAWRLLADTDHLNRAELACLPLDGPPQGERPGRTDPLRGAVTYL